MVSLQPDFLNLQNISIRFLLPFDTEGTMTGSCNDYVMFYTGIRPSLVNCIRSATAQAAYQVVAGELAVFVWYLMCH